MALKGQIPVIIFWLFSTVLPSKAQTVYTGIVPNYAQLVTLNSGIGGDCNGVTPDIYLNFDGDTIPDAYSYATTWCQLGTIGLKHWFNIFLNSIDTSIEFRSGNPYSCDCATNCCLYLNMISPIDSLFLSFPGAYGGLWGFGTYNLYRDIYSLGCFGSGPSPPYTYIPFRKKYLNGFYLYGWIEGSGGTWTIPTGPQFYYYFTQYTQLPKYASAIYDTINCNSTYTFVDGFTMNNILHDTNYISTFLHPITGLDSLVFTKLHVTTYQADLFDTICAGTNFSFADGSNMVLNHDTNKNNLFLSSTGCDSLIINHVSTLPLLSSSQNFSICANQLPYLWNGLNFTASGNYVYTTLGSNGCDSTANLILDVLPNTVSNTTLSLCMNQTPYSWNGQSLTSSGNFIYQTTGSNGCDSTATLTLNIIPYTTSSTTSTLSICNNQLPYSWNGQNLTASGNYSYTSSGANGCDSTAHLTLSILPNSVSNSSLVLCANQLPYSWNGQNLTASGNYSYTSNGVNGCDSTANLTLSILPNSVSNSSLVLCTNQLPYSWNGQNLTAAGNYSYTSNGVNGCDSTANLTLSILPNAVSNTSLVLCANQLPYSWNGQNLTASGIYSYTSNGVNGCDSTANLTLSILPNAVSNTSLVLCANQLPYSWNGQNLTASGIYSYPSTGSNGCDSTANLTLTVLPNNIANISFDICADQVPFSWNGQTLYVNGIYTDVCTGSTGCDSTTNLSLTINPNPTPIIVWNGTYFQTQSFYNQYQWIYNSINIFGATDSIYYPIGNGYYSVKVTDSNGCSNTTAVYHLVTSTYHYSKEDPISVYPNPANATLFIQFNSKNSYHIMITDIHGRKVYEKSTASLNELEAIDIRSWTRGLYTIQVTDQQHTLVRKILKE